MWTTVSEYLQAGLDESLANFVKGVFASAVVAALGYAIKHAVNFQPTTVEIVTYMALGSPALVHFWNWVTTTASGSQAPAPSGPADTAGIAA